MHAAIGAAVVIDSENDNVFFYDDGTRYPVKAEHGAYYGFYMDESV